MFNDLVGFVYIMIFFIIACLLGYVLLSVYKLKKKYILVCVFLSAILHFLGAIAYWHMTFTHVADAAGYFFHASNISSNKGLMGANLIVYLVGWLRYLIFGSSYLGVYSFFAMMGFLGSVLYLIIFHELLLIVGEKNVISFLPRNMKYCSFLVACWPSAMYWASNLGKDSLCYFLIALFFLSLIKINKNFFYWIALILSAVFMYLIRPYLFLIEFFAFVFWIIISSRKHLNFFIKFFFLIVTTTIFISIANDIAHFAGFTSYSILDISDRVIKQQEFLASGTHIDVLTRDPRMLSLFLPFSMFANLFMPLFFNAKNVIGVLASFENFFLLIMFFFFLKNRKYWRSIRISHYALGYMLWFFIVGIAYLGMVNTNLGLAVRQKLMYLPVFLIIMLITFLFRRTVAMQERSIYH